MNSRPASDLPPQCPSSRAPKRGRHLLLYGALSLWLALVAAGAAVLTQYAAKPSRGSNPPVRWPAASKLAPPQGRLHAVVFLHPKCPCSAATVRELERAIVAAPDAMDFEFVVFALSGMPGEWSHTSLVQSALALPRAHCTLDAGGIEAANFDAHTSGQVMIYDASGSLLFSGGVTPARGHEGPNAGRTAIDALVRSLPADVTRTPVFGCALDTPACGDGGQVCNPQ